MLEVQKMTVFNITSSTTEEGRLNREESNILDDGVKINELSSEETRVHVQ